MHRPLTDRLIAADATAQCRDGWQINAGNEPRTIILVMGKEPTRGMLMLVCVATRGEISPRAVYTKDDLARTRRAKLHVYCRFSGESHVFNFSDARLRPIQD